MLTAVECLAKAAEMDTHAAQTSNPANSAEFAAMANTWRRNAAIARQQDAWLALHPLDD